MAPAPDVCSSVNIFIHLLLWNQLNSNFIWILHNVRGPRICLSNCHGYTDMTKMTATSIFGKGPLKSSSPKSESQWPWEFVCSIGNEGPTKMSKWIWSGNTTITNCRQTHGIVGKSQTTTTRHQEDKLSKATSFLFPIKMIAKLEWAYK